MHEKLIEQLGKAQEELSQVARPANPIYLDAARQCIRDAVTHLGHDETQRKREKEQVPEQGGS